MSFYDDSSSGSFELIRPEDAQRVGLAESVKHVTDFYKEDFSDLYKRISKSAYNMSKIFKGPLYPCQLSIVSSEEMKQYENHKISYPPRIFQHMDELKEAVEEARKELSSSELYWFNKMIGYFDDLAELLKQCEGDKIPNAWLVDRVIQVREKCFYNFGDHPYLYFSPIATDLWKQLRIVIEDLRCMSLPMTLLGFYQPIKSIKILRIHRPHMNEEGKEDEAHETHRIIQSPMIVLCLENMKAIANSLDKDYARIYRGETVDDYYREVTEIVLTHVTAHYLHELYVMELGLKREPSHERKSSRNRRHNEIAVKEILARVITRRYAEKHCVHLPAIESQHIQYTYFLGRGYESGFILFSRLVDHFNKKTNNLNPLDLDIFNRVMELSAVSWKRAFELLMTLEELYELYYLH